MQQLYRSRDNRMIAGVASGMAKFFNLDISLVRLLWLLAVFLGGSGIIAYLIAWVVIPEEPDLSSASFSQVVSPGESGQPSPGGEGSAQPRKDRQLGGMILIGLGIFFLIKEIIPGDIFHYFWPLILVALGIYLLMGKK